jgi:hypothetical protein
LTQTTTPTPTSKVVYRHNICVNGNLCSTQDCSPNDRPCDSNCTSDSDCVTAKLTHKACVNNACKVVDGAGTDQCQNDVVCQPPPVTPETPKAATINPTILSVVGGAILLLGGLLLAF